MLERPASSEYAPHFARYIEQVPDGDFYSTLEQQGRDTVALLRPIGEAQSQFRYAPDKWSIREVVGHVIDSERVFAYRALRFARGDATPLAGFDEKPWAAASNAHARTLASLLDEFQVVRAATLSLLRSFDVAAWDRGGLADDVHVTVRALAWILAGHERHHVNVLRERYLKP